MIDVKTILIGEKSRFAIESGILKAYEEPGFKALGFFVIYIQGNCYGVREPDATMLACSIDEVERRISDRGSHIAAFANEPDALKIAKAYCDVRYNPAYEGNDVLGISGEQFKEAIYSKGVQWAPDGDEAFDDGSFVLQFDLETNVRLIAFQFGEDYSPIQNTLKDLHIGVNEFYGILEKWRDAFEEDWKTMPKFPENN